MAEDRLRKVEQRLSCDPEELPAAIEGVLEQYPRSARVLIQIKRTLESRELEGRVLAKCARIVTERTFSDSAESAGGIDPAKESVLLANTMVVIQFLVGKSVPAKDAVAIFRCLNDILPVPAKASYLKVLYRVGKDVVFQPDPDHGDSDVQESALWHLWYKVQLDATFESTQKNGAAVTSMKWKNFSYSALKNWSSTLNTADPNISSRFIAGIIRFYSSDDIDVFRILENIKLRCPMKNILRLLSERQVEPALQQARKTGLVGEYIAVLNVISAHFLNVFEAEKQRNKLLQVAEVVFAILRCMIAEEQGSVDNILLLARHLIYNRKSFSTDELERFNKLIGELRNVLPFSNEKHSIWNKHHIAKLGHSISALIRDTRDSCHATAIADTFMGIMRVQMSLAPESKDSLQLLRTATAFIEFSLYTQSHNGVEPVCMSSSQVFLLLKLYGPDNIDPMLLVACVSYLRQKDSFLCNCIDASDPEFPKWLALELYALLRLNADMESIAYVQSILQRFSKIEGVPEIMAVGSLRANALNGISIEDELSVPEANVLVESARRGIIFGVKHMQLSVKVAQELEQIRNFLRDKPLTGHEAVEHAERVDLCTDYPLALSTLCCGNFTDLFRNMRWPFDNHKRMKGMPYWVLLATFVLDDLRTAAAFYAINGDYVNQLRSLACLHVLMSHGKAPQTMIIDNKLRMVEALIFTGCTENARAITEKLEPLIQTLPMYSEEFFYLENKLERLKLCILIEENGAEPPEDFKPITNIVRSSALDKLRAYALGRYFQGKSIHQWNLHAMGELVATDCFDSCIRSTQTLMQILEGKRPAMTTWEYLELAYLFLVSNSFRADITFDMGAMRDTTVVTSEGHSKSQRCISFYFLLRNMERLIRMAVRFEISIDSKMSLVSDLIDPRRTETKTMEAEEAPDAEESFDIRKADSIPYKTALFLKMRQYQIDISRRRLPAKEFLKFNKRRHHSRECKCPICSSIGIEVTLRRIDAITASMTKEKLVSFEGSLFDRLGSGLRSIARVNEFEVRSETHCERIVQEAELMNAFHLAQGYAGEGRFNAALEVLDDFRAVELSNEDALEMCLRKFEYTYQIDWQEALRVLNVHSNMPVETSATPTRTCDTFKTPAPVRKREVKNVPARRRMRFPSVDSESGASSDEDAPEKKIPKKADVDIQPEVMEKARPQRKCAIKAKQAALAPNSENQDKPKFFPLDEFSGVTTRRKKNRSDMPRSESATKKIASVDDLFDDEGETSFVETFARMNFRDRLRKPKQMSQCNAEAEFQILLEAARKCEPLKKQSVVTDLFQSLAFLSAHRNNRLEFAYYLEKSIGISVHMAALNRGSKTADCFDKEIFASDYLNLLRPTTHFDSNWHERIWDWCDKDWVIVQLSTIMEGGNTPGIVVTRYEHGREPDIVHLSATHDAHFHGSLLKHYDDIQVMNKLSLSKSVKTDYWKRRYEAEKLLHEFCVALENSWIGCWKGVFRAEICGPEKRIVHSIFTEILTFAKSHGFRVDERMLSVGLQGIDALNPEQLTGMLSKVLGARYHSEVKQIQGFANSLISTEEINMLSKAARKPVILVLDKLLINIPFDSCPMFAEAPHTRMPSVPFTVAHALFLKKRKKKDPFVLEDPSEGFYVVNPGKDLPGMEERFMKQLRSIHDLWEGTVGEFLTRENFRKFLQSKSVYMYSGHGSGRQFMKEHLELINVRAVILLFGCSTGKMRRLGTKMDTEGHALRYLIGGSPAVVGNLWDVTDIDIDLFAYGMLCRWLYRLVPSEDRTPEPQLGAAVNKSRTECRMKALVGAAVVVYGLPSISYTK